MRRLLKMGKKKQGAAGNTFSAAQLQSRINKISKKLEKSGIFGIRVSQFRESVLLEGQLDKWKDKITAGKAAVGYGFKGVLNDITIKDLVQDDWNKPSFSNNSLEGEHFDVVIIGGGVTGCAILRTLSKYDIRAAVFEKESDVAMHASSRNDGMVHPGFAAKPGSKKAAYNVRGNQAYTQLTKELKVPLIRPGSIFLFSSPLLKLILPVLKVRSKMNGVPGCKYFSTKEIVKRNPYLGKKCYGGFFMPTAGQLNPYRLVIALAEHAIENGSEVYLETIVESMTMQKGIKSESTIHEIKTNRGNVTADVVINAAGVWADRIAEMADDRFYSIHYRKGTDLIMDVKTDRFLGNMMAMPDLSQRKSTSKGGGLVKTVEGNVLVGPTAVEQPYREDFSTEIGELKDLFGHISLIPKISKKDIITYFSGIRAATWEEDFVIEPSSRVDNFIHVAGIQSPGLASAPAIAEDVAAFAIEILSRTKKVEPDSGYNPERKSNIPEPRFMDDKQRDDLVKQDSSYGRIVCRCEEISEGEIRDAIHSPLPVYTVDGIKRRARAGAGRCHGGFCAPRVLEILSRESGVPIEQLTKKGNGSFLFYGKTKEEAQ